MQIITAMEAITTAPFEGRKGNLGLKYTVRIKILETSISG